MTSLSSLGKGVFRFTLYERVQLDLFLLEVGSFDIFNECALNV